MEDLLFYVASHRGSDAAELLWQEICWVIGKHTIERNNKLVPAKNIFLDKIFLIKDIRLKLWHQ